MIWLLALIAMIANASVFCTTEKDKDLECPRQVTQMMSLSRTALDGGASDRSRTPIAPGTPAAAQRDLSLIFLSGDDGEGIGADLKPRYLDLGLAWGSQDKTRSAMPPRSPISFDISYGLFGSYPVLSSTLSLMNGLSSPDKAVVSAPKKKGFTLSMGVRYIF